MKTSPISAKISNNGSWPAAPSGHAWLKPNDTIRHDDINVRAGDVEKVAAHDVGCSAGQPIIFQDGGFRHYARKVENLASMVASEPLTSAQKRRLLARAGDIYFLLDLADANGFLMGTSLSRNFRDHRDFILRGRNK